MNKSHGLLFGLAIITLVVTILFCGISRDPEFNDPGIFVKHRPSMKLHFYTPIGESDLKLENLTEDKRKEELLYREFIEDQRIYTDNLNRFWLLPPVLIQLTLTFLSLAIRRIEIKRFGILIHFLINIGFCVFAISFALNFDEFWTLTFIGGLLIILNIWTTKFAKRKGVAQ